MRKPRNRTCARCEKQDGKDGARENHDPEVEGSSRPFCAAAHPKQAPMVKENPHAACARQALTLMAVDPGDGLREQHDGGERQVDDEEEVPGDARVGKRIPHTRAEGGHAVEQDVAGDADAIDQGEHGQGGGFGLLQPGGECG